MTEKPIKVLQIVEALGGGVYSYFMDLNHYLGPDQNLELYIIYSDQRNEIDPEKIRSSFHERIQLIRITMHREISPLADIRAIFQIRKSIRDIDPDIIHMHSSKAGVLGRIASSLTARRTVKFYTPHGYSFIRKDISSTKKKFFYLIEKYAQRLFGGVTIACGDTEYEYAKEIGDAELVRNGINIPDIQVHKKPFENRKITVGILGRITYARDPGLFNNIALRHPDLQFLWIGDGELRDLITAPNIEVTGWFTNRHEGLSYLNTLDIYIQTSLWEGLPISILEAMTLEKPVLATHIIGNKDIVVHGVTGYLFHRDNLEELDHFLELLKTEERRKSMGREGYARIEELFSSKKNFSGLKDLYARYYSNKSLKKH